MNGDMIIDDDPHEVEFNRKAGKKGILISPYRKGKAVKPGELDDIRRAIGKGGRGLRG